MQQYIIDIVKWGTFFTLLFTAWRYNKKSKEIRKYPMWEYKLKLDPHMHDHVMIPTMVYIVSAVLWALFIL